MSTICSCSGYFMAYSIDAQEISNLTTLTFDQEIVKDLGQYTHTSTSGLVEVKSNGLYEITYGVNFNKTGIGAGPCELLTEVYKNGQKLTASQQFAVSNSAGHPDVGVGATTITFLNNHDTLSLRAEKITSTGSTIHTVPSGTWFAVKCMASI